jgi:hypothetical protein
MWSDLTAGPHVTHALGQGQVVSRCISITPNRVDRAHGRFGQPQVESRIPITPNQLIVSRFFEDRVCRLGPAGRLRSAKPAPT